MATKVERHIWRHAVEDALLIVGVCYLIASTAGHLPLWPIAVLGLAATIAVCFTVRETTGAGGLAAVTFFSGLGIVGWVAYTHFTTPWSLPAAFALALATLILTPLGAISFARHVGRVEAAEAQAKAARERAELAKWSALLERLGAPGCMTLEVLENRAGRSVYLRLPREGNVTLATLHALSEKVAIALRLPSPQSCRFERGKKAADVVMILTERDVLAEEVSFPAKLTPISVNNPFGIGIAEDGAQLMLLLREVATLIVGIRGSGKTNLLNVLIAQLSRMVDVVVFGIDLKGGRLLAPWIRPWLNDECPRPVIDWIATDRDEAYLMLDALVRLVRIRNLSLSGGEKIIPSTDETAFILVCDELAEIFMGMTPARFRAEQLAGTEQGATNTDLAYLGKRLTQLGRSEAVDPVWASIRGNANTVPADIKAQCDLRVGLGVATLAEAQTIVPDEVRAQKLMAALQHQGTGLITSRHSPGAAGKFWRLEPSRVEEIARQTGWIRPEPDPRATEALGAAYATRWERAAPLIDQWRAMPAPGASLSMVRQPGEFERIVARMEDPEERLHPARRRMREIVSEAGFVGIRVYAVERQLRKERMGVARETISRWLSADAKLDPPLVELRDNGHWRTIRDRDVPRTGTDS
jgi:hypothetical protein